MPSWIVLEEEYIDLLFYIEFSGFLVGKSDIVLVLRPSAAPLFYL